MLITVHIFSGIIWTAWRKPIKRNKINKSIADLLSVQ